DEQRQRDIERMFELEMKQKYEMIARLRSTESRKEGERRGRETERQENRVRLRAAGSSMGERYAKEFVEDADFFRRLERFRRDDTLLGEEVYFHRRACSLGGAKGIANPLNVKWAVLSAIFCNPSSF